MVALTLAACAAARPIPPPTPPTAAVIAPVVATSTPAPRASRPPPAPAVTASTPAPEPVATAPPIDDDPGQVMDRDGAAIEALLGPPGLRRKEPPAQVWQYRGEGCVLDLYLYPDGDGRPPRVTYFELRGVARGTEARRCFRGLLRGDGVAG